MPGGVADGALIIDTGLNNSGVIRDARQFRRCVETLTQAVERSGQQMAGGMDGYLRSLRRASAAATGEQAAIQKQIDKTAAAIARLEERQEIARRKFEAGREDAIARATEQFQERNAGADLMPWEDEATALEQLSEDMNLAAQAAADAYGVFEDTSAFRNMSVEADYLRERLAELQAQLAATQSGGEGDTGVAPQLEQTAEAAEHVESAENGAIQAGNGLQGAFAGIASGAGSALGMLARMAGNGALGFLKKLASGAKNAAIQLVKLAGRAIGNGIKKIGGMIAGAAKSMLGLNKATKAADGGLKKGLMSILKYGLGIRGLFALFRRLRTAIADGFEAMAKSNPQLKASLDSLKASLNGLKGSLATAFAPIVTAVAPALTKLINMLTSAINAIGAFMAALTGQKTYQKAVAGLEATGSAASGAAGSVKDLKRELAGFDQLNILGKSDSGSGNSGSGSGPAYHYETEEIGGGITDFVAKLKELWANADYEGVGQQIAGTINKAFEKARDLISWDNIGDKITEAVDAITGVFNGLVDGINWDLIGRTFGTGINTILNTVNQLLTKIDWANLGKKLAEGLNGLVDEVDWALLGDTIGQRFAAAVAVIGNFLLTFDWANLGSKMATGINSLFNKLLEAVQSIDWAEVGARIGTGLANLATGINWDNIGATLAAGFNAVLAVISEAIKNFDFVEAGKKFGSGLSRMVNDIDWASVGRTISDAAKGALDFLINAIREFDWNSLAVNIKVFLQNVDWAGVGGKVLELLSTALGAALGTIGKVVADLISDGFKGIKEYFDDSIEAAGGDVVAGIFNGIVNAVKNIGKWIYDHIFKPFIEAFKTAFGIASPAKEMVGPGEDVMNGVLEGILNVISTIGKWVRDNIFDAIIAAFNLAGTVAVILANIGRDIINAVLGGILDVMGGIVGFVADKILKPLVDAFTKDDEEKDGENFSKKLWRSISDEWKSSNRHLEVEVKSVTTAKMIWTQIAQDWLKLTEKTLKFSVAITETAKGLWEKLQSDWTSIKNKTFGIVAAFTNKATDMWNGLKTAWTAITGKTFGIVAAFTNKATDMWNGLKTAWTAITGKTFGIVAAFTNTAKSMWNGLRTAWTAITGKTFGIVAAFTNTAKSMWNGLRTAWTSIKDKIFYVDVALRKHEWTTVTKYVDDSFGGATGGGGKTAGGGGGRDFQVGIKLAEDKSTKSSSNLWDMWWSIFKKNTQYEFEALFGLKPGNGVETSGGGFKVKGIANDVAVKINAEAGNGFVSSRYQTGKNSFTLNPIQDSVVTVDVTPGWTGSATTAVGLNNLETDARVNLIKNWSGSATDWLGLKDLTTTIKAQLRVDNNQSKITLAQDAHDVNTWTLATQALGGIFENGFWRSIPQYAKGTHNAHGSLFLAGEAGPEVVGHVGGRTEVLNKSQLASTMFSAVTNGMLAALRRVEFRMPAMATGSVMPYDVSAQLAKSTADLQGTLDANNEDLIQTIISVAGQIVAAIGSTQVRQGQGGVSGLSVQQVISEINRQSQMMGASPLIGA